MNWDQHPTQRPITNAQQRAWSLAVRARDKTCQLNYTGCTIIATEADHIRNITEGGDPLDLSNGQGVCTNCHKQKTQSEATRGKNRWKRKPEKNPGLL